MLSQSSLARVLSLPDDPHGQVLAVLSIASLIVSSVSLGLSGVRLGSSSLFFIPAAWLMTMVHHLTTWRLLVRANLKTPLQTPQCLKRVGNIIILLALSMCWISGGALAIAFTIIKGRFVYGARTMSDVPDWVSSGLAFVEAGVLLFMMSVCWRALVKERYSEAT